jgi:hypothetical protein
MTTKSEKTEKAASAATAKTAAPATKGRVGVPVFKIVNGAAVKRKPTSESSGGLSREAVESWLETQRRSAAKTSKTAKEAVPPGETPARKLPEPVAVVKVSGEAPRAVKTRADFGSGPAERWEAAMACLDAHRWTELDKVLSKARGVAKEGLIEAICLRAAESDDVRAVREIRSRWAPFGKTDCAWRAAFDETIGKANGQEIRLLLAAWERSAFPRGRHLAVEGRGGLTKITPSLWSMAMRLAAPDPKALAEAWAAWEREPRSSDEKERHLWLERGQDALRAALSLAGSQAAAAKGCKFLLSKGWSAERSGAIEAACKSGWDALEGLGTLKEMERWGREGFEIGTRFDWLAGAGFDLASMPARVGRAAACALDKKALRWAQSVGAKFAEPAESGPDKGESALTAVQDARDYMGTRMSAEEEAVCSWVEAAAEREALKAATEKGERKITDSRGRRSGRI